jgi:hypothetical protein
VHRITQAPEALAVDQSRRERRYLAQMGVRVLCFLLAVTLWNHVPAAVSWVLIAGAVVLPYVAVLLANAGRERREVSSTPMDPRMIGPAPERRQVLDTRDDQHGPDDQAPRTDKDSHDG